MISLPRFILPVCAVTFLVPWTLRAEEPFVGPPNPRAIKADPGPTKPNLPAKMIYTGLAPSKLIPNLCVLRYRITTSSPECQAYFDQALGYLYSYVWMEAARSFETATLYDPECAIAYWGLSRALEKWGRQQPGNKALQRADELKGKAGWNEQQLILARMQEKGLAPNVGDAEARKKAAIRTIDNLLTVHDDDEEGWYYRAHLAGGQGFGGVVGAVPFYKALLRINPLHPGANHELVHYYENARRPALGWINAENYIKSSPGLPHAFHMQAHLGTRIGRWDRTTDWSMRAVELEQTYHKDMNVRPREDHQYSHHLEILTISLIHDGRFAEARQIRDVARKDGFMQWGSWFKLHLAERDWAEALRVVTQSQKRDKVTASYYRALVYLQQHDPQRAAPEVEVLRQAAQAGRNDKRLELKLWETQGRLLCQTGAGEAGVKLLQRTVDKTKDDFSHHAWGNGAYYMENWGIGALEANKLDVAEEAFLEALAHDSGSVRGALGLQVLCERQHRTEEASRYAALARRYWHKADPGRLDVELAFLRSCGASLPRATSKVDNPSPKPNTPSTRP